MYSYFTVLYYSMAILYEHISIHETNYLNKICFMKSRYFIRWAYWKHTLLNRV